MAKKLDSGVVLYAFGKPAYLQAAYNLAFSIKQFNPTVNITLFCESESALRKAVWNATVFDNVISINPERIRTLGKFDPGKVKVTMYDSLPYHYNLYIDCDTVALKDIQPLIDLLIKDGKPYVSHVVGYHTIAQGKDVIPSMQWAKADKVWNHWKLSNESVLPAINSSLQFIVKSNEAAKIFGTASDYYINNPLPLKDLNMKWGGGQPDELYMNASFAVNDYDPAPTVKPDNEIGEGGFIHFAGRQRNGEWANIVEQFYFHSYYGGVGFTNPIYVEFADRMLMKMHQKLLQNHNYKLKSIIKDKHANNKK